MAVPNGYLRALLVVLLFGVLGALWETASWIGPDEQRNALDAIWITLLVYTLLGALAERWLGPLETGAAVLAFVVAQAMAEEQFDRLHIDDPEGIGEYAWLPLWAVIIVLVPVLCGLVGHALAAWMRRRTSKA